MQTVTVKEGGLLDQYKLLCAVIDAPWSTRLDIKITRHVVDRYYAKFGNARVSLRFLERAIGSQRNKIVESLRRICANGVFNVVRLGAGTRPTEYALNFDFASKSPTGSEQGPATSGVPSGPSCGSQAEPSSGASGSLGGPKTCLQDRTTVRSTINSNNTPAAPSAPPLGGENATPAESAGDPFEALWTVYPRKQQRAKARAAFKALAPDEALHAKLIAAAVEWAERYRSSETALRWQKHLHTWLSGECWLEDPPEAYESPKEAAIARRRTQRADQPMASVRPVNALGLSPRTPQGEHEVEVIGSNMPDSPRSEEQRMEFRFRILSSPHEGREFSHTWKAMSADEHLLQRGQAAFAELRNAAGKVELNDTSDLHGARLRAIVRPMGRIEYEPL